LNFFDGPEQERSMPPDKVWEIEPPSSKAGEFAREAGLSRFQAQLLINRGISNPSMARPFMSPRLNHLANPMLLKDVDDALALIIGAMEAGGRITIYGDYDADGLTATALLHQFLKDLDCDVSYYIPDRLNEGYGMNMAAVDRIKAAGTDLIITVDCGISDSREIVHAKGLGMEVVVTDHHLPPEGYESPCPVINPHQPDCRFPFKDLAGVGLAFFLAVALRAVLRGRGLFESKKEPDLRWYTDLAALGTVADRVPLLDQNRILVAAGMEVMTMSRWAGIRAMLDVAGVRPSEITSDDLAFRMAPRLNAPGRLGEAGIAMELLTAQDSQRAGDLAIELERANNRRRAVERDILDQIEAVISQHPPDDSRSIVVAGDGWHKGVLGIVASRLVDKYRRPALVLGIRDGIASGSGRSIDGFNLHRALTRLGHLFERFGGHSHAAGLALKMENLDALRIGLEDLALKELGGVSLAPVLRVDAEVPLDSITPEMVVQTGSLAPFGSQNPEPLLLSRDIRVLESRIVGEHHLKLAVGGREKSFDAIGFGLAGKHPLRAHTVDMVYTPELNRWQGRERIQLRISDLASSRGL
jgi:single-stranded-DNA-specific exonuclease